MKIFKTTARKVIVLIIIFAMMLNNLGFGYTNPSKKEIESMIDTVAVKRGIPSVIMKSIAKLESSYEQFNSNGSPKITGDCIGLMMINNRNGGYDSNKLKYDIEYNIEAGADVLLNKWSMSSYNKVASVGDMNPDVLENWYFALWAYNGWAESNNPNVLPSRAKKYTYQQLIYNICEKEYSKSITNIDFSHLPSRGKPTGSLVVPTPSNAHAGGIILYEKDDFVRTDGVRNEYNLRDAPAGKYVHVLAKNQLCTVAEGPVLKNGYYWYKVYVNDSVSGWIERNWILRTGDTVYGRYVYDDISFHWARKSIMNLYNRGIVSESSLFYPDRELSKEEFCIFLGKTLNLKNEGILDSLPFSDKDKISPWAAEYVAKLYGAGMLNEYTEFNPGGRISRKEAAVMLSKVFEDDHRYDAVDISSIFSDIGGLTELEASAVKKVYTGSILSGKRQGSFCPDELLTRAEAAAIMVNVINKLEANN